jgi:hypothetical protein
MTSAIGVAKTITVANRTIGQVRHTGALAPGSQERPRILRDDRKAGSAPELPG